VLEIDPRGRHAQWTGIDNRSNLIAKAVLKATHDSNLEQATASISALLT
jgi:hypothetical protein